LTDVVVAAHTEPKSARRKIGELSVELEEMAEVKRQLADSKGRIEELEATIESYRAALRAHLEDLEAALSRDEHEAVELAQQAFFDLLGMIEANPEECLVDAPPPLADPKPAAGSKKGKKWWKVAPSSPRKKKKNPELSLSFPFFRLPSTMSPRHTPRLPQQPV
jgi:hypothetical protein